MLRRGHERNVYLSTVAWVITDLEQLREATLEFHDAWTTATFCDSVFRYIEYLGGTTYTLKRELTCCPISVRCWPLLPRPAAVV